MKDSASNVWQRLGAILLLFPLILPGAGEGQEIQVAQSSMSISSRAGGRAELELELADGSDQVISFRDGQVRVNGRAVGSYEPGGTLEAAWRELLSRNAASEPNKLGQALLDWEPEGLSDLEGQTVTELSRRLGQILGAAPAEVPLSEPETVTVTGPSGTQLSIAPGSISFEGLTDQLSDLHTSLGELGAAAADAEDKLALIVHDDYTIPSDRDIAGNLALLGGTLHLGGTVEGDVLVLDGTLILEPTAQVTGNVLQVGGDLSQEGGRIAGELLSIRPVAPEAVPATSPRARVRIAPTVVHVRHGNRARHRDRGFFAGTTHNLGHAAGGLIGTIGVLLVLGLLALITVYFGRPQLELVADTARYSLVRSLVVGLAGEILLLPVLLILAVLVITIPVIPFLALGAIVAMVGGYLASAHAVGEMFAARRYRYEWIERLRRSNAYYYVLSGLVLLTLPFAVEAALWVLGRPGGFLRGLATFVGCVLTWVAVTTGFGAVLLTRGGTRDVERAGWTASDRTWSDTRAGDSEVGDGSTDA